MKKLLKKVLFYGQRMIKSYKAREFIRGLQVTFSGNLNIEGDSVFVKKENEEKKTNELKVNGFSELDNLLTDDIINEIISFSKTLKLFDPFNRSIGDFEIESIQDGTNVANFYRKDLVGSSAIMDIANDPGVLRIVQEFLGMKPTISNVNMWWSKAGNRKAKDAQLFHRDVDDIRFCKLFIYLTDVGPNNGPHTYVKGSSSTNKLTKIRRYQDEEVERTFGKKNIINFTRPKGSCFLVDTYGFHKGTLPTESDRLLLQVQYSINPIGIENYEPVEKENSYHWYINRLLLK